MTALFVAIQIPKDIQTGTISKSTIKSILEPFNLISPILSNVEISMVKEWTHIQKLSKKIQIIIIGLKLNALIPNLSKGYADMELV